MVDIGASWMLVEKISLRCFGEVYQERLVRYLKVFLTAPKGIVEYIQELHFQLLPVTFAELRVNVHLVYPPENQSIVNGDFAAQSTHSQKVDQNHIPQVADHQHQTLSEHLPSSVSKNFLESGAR